MPPRFFLQFGCQSRYLPRKLTFSKTSGEEWNQNRILAFELVILGHVLFPKNPKAVDVKWLHSREQIEGGHTFVLAFLADTIRVLCIATTFSTHLECCASLLQIWLLEHLIVCKPLITKGPFIENLIQAHLKRITWDLFKNKED